MTRYSLYSLLTFSLIPILLYLYISIPLQICPPEIVQDEFFGSGHLIKDDGSIHPFLIKFSTQVKEMQRAAKESNAKLENGTFEKRITVFMSEFDWEKHSDFINSFPHFTTEIEGLSIHFIHTNIKHENRVNRVPILLLPSSFSSFWNFFKLLPILSNPTRHGFEFGLGDTLVFDVVIPSYPMTMFSESPKEKNLEKVDVSRIINKLMSDRLSYSKYFVFGDEGIGSEIASIISTLFPSQISGLIIMDPIINMEGIKRQLQLYLLPSDSIETKVDFPLSIPSLKDQTFSSSLKYLVERWKYSSNSIDLDDEITLDEIGTSFSLFILTNTLQSHIDLLRIPLSNSILDATTTVPTYIISSSNSRFHVPKGILDHKFMNIIRYDEIDNGGILYSLSKSTDLAQKIFSFVEER